MNRTALVPLLLCAAVVAALAGCRSTSEPMEQATAHARAERENAARERAARGHLAFFAAAFFAAGAAAFFAAPGLRPAS